jgi:hypothetical protein
MQQFCPYSSKNLGQYLSLVLCDVQTASTLVESGCAVKLPEVLHRGMVHQIFWWDGSKHGQMKIISKAHSKEKIILLVERGESDIGYVSAMEIENLVRFITKFDLR